MADANPSKRQRGEDTLEATDKYLAKKCIERGSLLTNKKETVLAHLKEDTATACTVLTARSGKMKEHLYLLPKELNDLVIVNSRNEKGQIDGLVGGHESDIELTISAIRMIAISWSSYKKFDAVLTYMTEDGIATSFPRTEVTSVDDLDVVFKGEKKKVPAWRIYTESGVQTVFTSPKTMLGFLELDVIKTEDFTRVATLIENTTVKEGYEQLDVNEFNSLIKTANVASDTSAGQGKRDLAGLLLGLGQMGNSMEDKINAFASHPSVTFATACGFLQVQKLDLFNVTSKSIVRRVKLSKMVDTDDVVMTKVPINTSYWSSLVDYEDIEVYKNDSGLAIKRTGKKQTTAQTFEVTEARYVKAISRIIVDFNKVKGTAKSVPKTQQDPYDDDLFD